MLKKLLSVFILFLFLINTIGPVPAHAQGIADLPRPGLMVSLSPAYVPLLIKGLKVHPDNPLAFDFIVDTGNDPVIASEAPVRRSLGEGGKQSQQEQLKAESQRLIKYFFAALTLPEKDIWVNLSPYEKDRIVPLGLGQTEMGRDLLAQDYILKQLTASLIYPEEGLGKDFWERIYKEAQTRFGTSQIPVNTFNKVWIVADKASVYEKNDTVFVVNSHLKVMLEEDYLATSKNELPTRGHVQSDSTRNVSPSTLPSEVALNAKATQGQSANALGSQIIRELILPAIEKEVNTGKNFAPLRQIFHSLILAKWYKQNLKEALLNQVYTDQAKVDGVDAADKTEKDKIYQQYLQAYKKGVFNYIKEDLVIASPKGEAISTQTTIPRKYFSGGVTAAMTVTNASVTEAMASAKEGGQLTAVAVVAKLADGLRTKEGGQTGKMMGRRKEGENASNRQRKKARIEEQALLMSWEVKIGATKKLDELSAMTDEALDPKFNLTSQREYLLGLIEQRERVLKIGKDKYAPAMVVLVDRLREVRDELAKGNLLEGKDGLLMNGKVQMRIDNITEPQSGFLYLYLSKADNVRSKLEILMTSNTLVEQVEDFVPKSSLGERVILINNATGQLMGSAELTRLLGGELANSGLHIFNDKANRNVSYYVFVPDVSFAMMTSVEQSIRNLAIEVSSLVGKEEAYAGSLAATLKRSTFRAFDFHRFLYNLAEELEVDIQVLLEALNTTDLFFVSEVEEAGQPQVIGFKYSLEKLAEESTIFRGLVTILASKTSGAGITNERLKLAYEKFFLASFDLNRIRNKLSGFEATFNSKGVSTDMLLAGNAFYAPFLANESKKPVGDAGVGRSQTVPVDLLVEGSNAEKGQGSILSMIQLGMYEVGPEERMHLPKSNGLRIAEGLPKVTVQELQEEGIKHGLAVMKEQGQIKEFEVMSLGAFRSKESLKINKILRGNKKAEEFWELSEVELKEASDAGAHVVVLRYSQGDEVNVVLYYDAAMTTKEDLTTMSLWNGGEATQNQSTRIVLMLDSMELIEQGRLEQVFEAGQARDVARIREVLGLQEDTISDQELLDIVRSALVVSAIKDDSAAEKRVIKVVNPFVQPRVQAEQSNAMASISAKERARNAEIDLLIVDDNKSMAKILEASYKKLGFKVSVGYGVEEALQWIREKNSNPKSKWLVISDFQMIDETAYDLLVGMKEGGFNLGRVLVNSSLPDDATERLKKAKRGKEFSAVPVVFKSTADQELFFIIYGQSIAQEIDKIYPVDSPAMLSSPTGGIDLNTDNMAMSVSKEGAGISMKFDPALVAEFKRGDFSGITPVIVSITPLKSILPLLGLN